MGGPFWIAPIHDKSFVRNILQSLESCNVESTNTYTKKFGTSDRMVGMLNVVEEELDDVPFYYSQDRLCSMAKVNSGKMINFRSALLNAGYKVSISHACKLAIKTNAPNDFVWAMMRAWGKVNQEKLGKREKLDTNSVASRIMNSDKIPEYENISFDEHPDANPASRLSNLKRFQMNPAPNWGPKMKAHTTQKQIQEKRNKNQGKTKRKHSLESENVENDNRPIERH